jgi:hypothetical protein
MSEIEHYRSHDIEMMPSGPPRIAITPRLSICNSRQILYPHETLLTGECERLVGALRLRHAKDPMVARVVNLDLAAALNNQSSRENRVPKIIL